jgi:predicted RNase H-like HicB family nuclease
MPEMETPAYLIVIAFHIEGLRRQGEPVPAPTTVAAVLLTTHAA